jgi:kynurenine formamidase
LVNLEKAPQGFMLACFPIKFEKDAAPCRAVAIIG